MTLPSEVRDLALRLGATPAPPTGPVTLTQVGSMRLRLDSTLWLPFSARQTMAVTNCSFSWKARFWPLAYLTVTDALQDGAGQLNVLALGLIPLVRTTPTSALTKGELIRYLAELPFAPDAILHNPFLHWTVQDANRLTVSAGAGDLRAEVTMTLDPDGRVQSFRAEDRPRSARPPLLETPWHGTYSDYRLQRGRWIPFAGQVGWVIDGQDQLYWRGTLTDWTPSAGDGQMSAQSTLPKSPHRRLLPPLEGNPP